MKICSLYRNSVMEEEEDPKAIKISGNGSDAHELDSGVKEIVGSLHKENVNASSDIGVERGDGNMQKKERGTGSVTTVMDEKHFEQVPLKDREENNEWVDSNRSSESGYFYGGNAEYSSGTYLMEYDSSAFASPPTCLDSTAHSPVKPEGMETLKNIGRKRKCMSLQ